MEYARYADGFIRREDHEHEWEACPRPELPEDWLEEQAALDARRERVARYGYDPGDPEAPGVTVRGNQPAPQSAEASLRAAINELLEGTAELE